MQGFVKIATVSELPPGERKLVEIEDVRIAIFNLEGDYYAIEDVCTHDGGPLVEGDVLEGGKVRCPRHGACFDIRTGRALSMPAFSPTATYEVKVDGDDVWVEAPY
ncbi:MAG: non-heme iron oxygenase ferredoxin subunit [Caldilineaceae bacterium]|nr:non-heme iron oxygenase ferredoxin subunit [Caldilineaceae bacterium]